MSDLGAYENLKIDLEKELYFFKYRIIILALKANNGNVAATAKQLMIRRTTLVMMMQKFNIKRCYYLLQGY